MENQSAAFADDDLSEEDLDAEARFESDELLEDLDSDDGLASDAGLESPDAFEEESPEDLSPPLVVLAPDSDESVLLGAGFLA